MVLEQVEGVAAREGEPFYPNWGWAPAGQILEDGVLAEAVDADPTVELLLRHEGWPLATTDTDTLEISASGGALLFEATLDTDQADAALAYQKVAAGFMTQASFGYWVLAGRWVEIEVDSEPEEIYSVSSLSMNEGDISIVRFGGNPNTETASVMLERRREPDWRNSGSQRSGGGSSTVPLRPVRSNLGRLLGRSGRKR